MSETGYTKKQVIEMINSLKETLANYNTAHALQVINGVKEFQQYDADDGIPLEYCSDVALEKIKAINEIQVTRESTYSKLLDFYLRLYDELDKEETDA